MDGYRIFKVTKDKDGKETQGIYPQDGGKPIVYQYEDDAIADYEVRLGQAMASDNTDLATFLMVMGTVGEAVRQAYVAKTHNETDKEGKEIEVKYEISPRLIDVKVSKGDGEVPNVAKYDTVNDVHSNFHLKLGRAMQNPDVMAIVLYGVGTLGESLDTTHWVRTAPIVESEPEIPEE